MIAGGSMPAGTTKVFAPFDRTLMANIETSGAEAVEMDEAIDRSNQLP